jgi:hypothetical protein
MSTLKLVRRYTVLGKPVVRTLTFQNVVHYVRYQTSDHMKVIEVIQDGLSDNSKCGCNMIV